MNLEIKGKKLSRTQMVEFAWCQNLLPKKRTGHAPVEVIFGGFPKGIFEDPDEEELSTGDQNPIADKVSTELTTKAYKGMIEQEEKKGEKEILQEGQRVKHRRNTKIQMVERKGTVIVANHTSALVIFDNTDKPWWVRTDQLTKI